MSIVSNALKEIQNKNVTSAERLATEASAKAGKSAAFIGAAAAKLKPIADAILKSVAEDLQREGYAAEYSFQEFTTHIVASVTLCPRTGDKPKDINGLNCGMAQAWNTGGFMIRIDSASQVSITGLRSYRTHEKCVDTPTTLSELNAPQVAQLLHLFLVTILSPSSGVKKLG